MMYIKRFLALAAFGLMVPAAAFAASDASYSRNWAGYVASGQSYDGAYATWTIPTVAAASATAADATWVGVGGYQTTDLIQAGTFAKVQNGNVSYQAWYELIPAGMVTVPLAVSPGDTVTASIRSRDEDHWTITISNDTTGRAYAVNVTYASSRSSVEWVEERPSWSDGSLVPLDSFGSVTFSNVGASVNGIDQPYSALHAIPLIMSNANLADVVSTSWYTDTGFKLDRMAAEASDPGVSPVRSGTPERTQVEVVPSVGSSVATSSGTGSYHWSTTTSNGWHIDVQVQTVRGAKLVPVRHLRHLRAR